MDQCTWNQWASNRGTARRFNAYKYSMRDQRVPSWWCLFPWKLIRCATNSQKCVLWRLFESRGGFLILSARWNRMKWKVSELWSRRRVPTVAGIIDLSGILKRACHNSSHVLELEIKVHSWTTFTHDLSGMKRAWQYLRYNLEPSIKIRSWTTLIHIVCASRRLQATGL